PGSPCMTGAVPGAPGRPLVMSTGDGHLSIAEPPGRHLRVPVSTAFARSGDIVALLIRTASGIANTPPCVFRVGNPYCAGPDGPRPRRSSPWHPSRPAPPRPPTGPQRRRPGCSPPAPPTPTRTCSARSPATSPSGSARGAPPPPAPSAAAPSASWRARAATAPAWATRPRSVRPPSVGADRRHRERLVEGVDLAGPGVGDAAALDEAGSLYAAHAVWFHHPSYLAHLNCPVVLPAVAAEAMLAAINTSVDTYDQSLVATLMEQRLVRWTAERIGFAAGDGVFTSGGTQSNLQALYLARSRAERTAGEEPAALPPRLRVLATEAAHFSVTRSARLLGLGEDAVLPVPADADGRMDVAALRQALASVDTAGELPMAIVATAGTTDRGLIDQTGRAARRE